MISILRGCFAIWQKRGYFFLPLVLVPLAVMALYYGYTPKYTASTVIGVNAEASSTTLLRNIEREESVDILNRRLFTDALLLDAARESGLSPNAASFTGVEKEAFLERMKKDVSLTIVGGDMMRLTYRSGDAAQTVKTLEHIARNFIEEVLAPERYKAEKTLMSLGEQIQHYSRVVKQKRVALEGLSRGEKEAEDAFLRRVVRVEFDIEKAEAQRDIAKESYEKVLAQSRGLLVTGAGGQTILKLEEMPTLMPTTFGKASVREVLCAALLLGLLTALTAVLMAYTFDATLSKDDDVYAALGLRILGRIPALGDVQQQDGVVSIELPSTRGNG